MNILQQLYLPSKVIESYKKCQKRKKNVEKSNSAFEEQKRGKIWSYNMFPSLKPPLFLKMTFFGMSETFVVSRLIKAFRF